MKLRPYGDRGILLAALSEAERGTWLAKLEETLPPGCSEFVVGYDSILLIGHSIDLGADTMPTATKSLAKPANCQNIEVVYNGADLEFVAKACRLTIEQVIERHCAPTYTVRMMGFSPGFPYLDGLDSRLHLDRRTSPRNRIEAGSVAIGGAHAGIYSVASPGGWHLLGQTDLTLFNLDAAQASNPKPQNVFALSPGDQVRFQPRKVRK